MEQLGTIIKERYMPKTDKLVVLGNPPYQKYTTEKDVGEGGNNQAKPIYHLFVDAIIEHLKPKYFSFIIPSRWMVGGMGLDNFRNKMMNDRRIKKISHFKGEREIFPTVLIKGGVNYFFWDRDYDGKCTFEVAGTTTERYLNDYDIIIQDNNAIGILEKVKNVAKEWMNKPWNIQNPFNIFTTFKNWVESGVPCYTQRKQIKYVAEKDYIDKNNIIGKWKVCTSKGINPNSKGDFEVYNTLFISEPNSICTETYRVVNIFDTEEEAENFVTYMKTRFFRFMLGIRVLTQNISKESFSFVPDIKEYSHMDDEKLYKMFNLTKQQQSYIEGKIKEI